MTLFHQSERYVNYHRHVWHNRLSLIADSYRSAIMGQLGLIGDCLFLFSFSFVPFNPLNLFFFPRPVAGRYKEKQKIIMTPIFWVYRDVRWLFNYDLFFVCGFSIFLSFLPRKKIGNLFSNLSLLFKVLYKNFPDDPPPTPPISVVLYFFFFLKITKFNCRFVSRFVSPAIQAKNCHSAPRLLIHFPNKSHFLHLQRFSSKQIFWRKIIQKISN